MSLLKKMLSNSLNFDIKIVNKSGFELPKFSKLYDSGIDLRSTHIANIKPGEITPIHTGLYIELPDPDETFPFVCEMQIRPRSGLAAKQGIIVANTPGTIDNQYRGEIIVLLTKLKYMSDIERQKNNSIFKTDNFLINSGDRVAQAVVVPVFSNVIHIREVEELSETERNKDGFGSTGTK